MFGSRATSVENSSSVQRLVVLEHADFNPVKFAVVSTNVKFEIGQST